MNTILETHRSHQWRAYLWAQQVARGVGSRDFGFPDPGEEKSTAQSSVTIDDKKERRVRERERECVCVCVCVKERKGERKREREGGREKGSNEETKGMGEEKKENEFPKALIIPPAWLPYLLPLPQCPTQR